MFPFKGSLDYANAEMFPLKVIYFLIQLPDANLAFWAAVELKKR